MTPQTSGDLVIRFSPLLNLLRFAGGGGGGGGGHLITNFPQIMRLLIIIVSMRPVVRYESHKIFNLFPLARQLSPLDGFY
jgi:hypothetical protein